MNVPAYPLASLSTVNSRQPLVKKKAGRGPPNYPYKIVRMNLSEN